MDGQYLDKTQHVRAVTEDEIRDFNDNGWVKLPGLVSGTMASKLLAHLKIVTGLDYDEIAPTDPGVERVVEKIQSDGLAKTFYMSRLSDEAVWEFVTSRALGEAAALLTGTRPLRLLTDGVICKLPEWAEGRIEGIFSGETPWHQDFGAVPWDRSGGIQFWLALCEITPEMGSMQHLNGSHREPPRGCVQYTQDQTVVGLYPELFSQYEVAPAHHLHPGDVLAHDSLTFHFAQPNRTNRLRWAYTSYRVPANTLYNGIPNARFTEFNFVPWQPFDHPKFPIVAL